MTDCYWCGKRVNITKETKFKVIKDRSGLRDYEEVFPMHDKCDT